MSDINIEMIVMLSIILGWLLVINTYVMPCVTLMISEFRSELFDAMFDCI